MTSRVLAYVFTGQDRSLSRTGEQAAKNIETTSKKIGASIQNAGKAFLLAGVTVAGASIKMASDFQASMQQINALAGVSQKQVDSWSKQILALGGTLPQAPKELAEGLYSIASSGIPASKAMETLKASARAAAAGLGTVQSVADAVSSALNAYRGTSLTASKSTDILVTAVKDGKAEADSFASSIGQVIPAASTLGVSFDQVAAAMASLTLTGSDAAESATQIRGIFNSLIKPTDQGSKALANMGLSYEGLQQELKQKGLLATLQTLHTKIGDNKTAMTDIFPDVRALTGYLSLTGKNAGQVAGIFGDLKNSTGATDKAFKSASQTVQFKFNVAMASMKTNAIQLGSVMLPVMANIFTVLSKILAPLSRCKAAFATLGVGVLLFAATVKLSMALVSTSVKAALVTSVVGIAILLLTVAITELLLHWKTVWGVMRTVINVFRDAMVSVLKVIVNYFLWWAGMIIHAAAMAFGWIPGLGGKLKDAAKKFDQFRDNVNRSIDGLKSKTVSVGVKMFAGQGGGSGGSAPIIPKAAGGHIRGPGGPRSDTAGLFALSNGEYVQPTEAVNYYGVDMMEAIRSRRFPRLSAGGGVNVQAHTPAAGAIGSSIWSAVVKFVQKNWVGGGLGSVLALAESFVGKVPYVWGGATPAGWDCSGMVSWIYNKLGMHSGRQDAAGLQGWATATGPIPGGMAFYGTPAHHVGFVLDGSHLLSALGRQWGTTISSLNLGDNSGYGVPPGRGLGSGGPGATGSLQELAFSMLSQRGWGGQWSAFNALENREAGWNMNAVNPSSGAYGLAQFINGAGEYAQYGGTWLTAAGQLTGMLNYIAQRYGSPNAAWGHEMAAGWYNMGGPVSFDTGMGMLRPGYTIAHNGTGRNEFLSTRGHGESTFIINISPTPMARPADIGREVVGAIREYEKRAGKGWRS